MDLNMWFITNKLIFYSKSNMQTLKETNVKYTTKINSNGDKTVNIKTSNGANVTNVYDKHTNEFKYCYDHNLERVKSYKKNGQIYDYHDDSKPRYNYGYNHGYNYCRSYEYHDDSNTRYNGYNRSYNPKKYN